jgi:hypothetical protein
MLTRSFLLLITSAWCFSLPGLHATDFDYGTVVPLISDLLVSPETGTTYEY